MSQEQIVRFRKGEILFEQGEASREMYILQAGKVRVYISKGGRRIPLTDLGRGSFVGEMSFLTGQPRSASVEALEPVVANRITPKLLQEEAMGLPGWIVTVAQVLVRRLKNTTIMLGDYLQADVAGKGEDAGGASEDAVDPVQGHLEEGASRSPFRLDVEAKEGRLYPRGYFSDADVKTFHSRLKAMKEDYDEVVIDFSGVMDVDRKAVGYLTKLARVKDSSLKIRFENVQLIREKISAIRNIHQMVVKTQLPERKIPKGTRLIEQGGTDKMMYIVREGTFRVFHEAEGKTVELEKVGQGDVIGEMALIRRGVRSASVMAETEARVAEIDADQFYNNGYNIPAWFLQIIQGLVHRIRETHQMLDDVVARRGDEGRTPDGAAQEETDGETEPEADAAADTAAEPEAEAETEAPGGAAEDPDAEEGVPLVMALNPSQPGTIKLQGDLTFENLDYVSIMLQGFREREIYSVDLRGDQLTSADPSAASYLINIHMELKKKGGGLSFSGFPQEFLDAFQGD